MKKLLAMVIATVTISAVAADAPFSYPSSLLEGQATYDKPVGDHVRIGKPIILLGQTKLEDVSKFTGASRLRDGTGMFARDYLCLESTEKGKRYITWVVSSDTVHVTEAQIERISSADNVPGYCKRLRKEHQPVRLGKFGMSMTLNDVVKYIGQPSHSALDGWRYWFSQRFFRNSRNLQELELNWLAIHYDEHSEADKAFISIVDNP